MDVKRFLALLLCLLFLAASASAETLSFGAVSADKRADYIDMAEEKVADWPAFISFLQEFPNLTRVDMFSTQVTEKEVAMLEEALPAVEFGWTLQLMKYKDKHIVRTDATYFSTRHGFCPNHRSEEFALLRYAKSLLALDLGHNNLTDISFLRNMPNLRVLILGENQKLKNVGELAALQDLEYLELFTCGIRDITPLTKLTKLMDLNLGNNQVEDWRPLKEMTWLKRLWIPGMTAHGMSNADLQELQEALPDTVIMAERRFVSNPTGNGWRYYSDYKADKAADNLVPHYAVIKEMMEEDAYIPFAESAPLEEEEDHPEDVYMVTDVDPAGLDDTAADPAENNP